MSENTEKRPVLKPVKKEIEIPLVFNLNEVSPNKKKYLKDEFEKCLKEYIETDGTFYDFRALLDENVVIGIKKFFDEKKDLAKVGKIKSYRINNGNVYIKVDIDSFVYLAQPLPLKFNVLVEGEIVETEDSKKKDDKNIIMVIKPLKFFYVYADDTKEIREIYQKVIGEQIKEFNEKYKDVIEKANKEREKNNKKASKSSKKSSKKSS